MRLFPPELNIDPTEGFTPQKDIFGRKEFGVQLTRLVRGMGTPGVLLLDAPWGTGKSTFVKMWRGELYNNGIPSIYFDAFANDYQEDAFLAVASHIIAEAEQQRGQVEQVLDDFKEKALKAAKVLGRAALRLGIRVATAGAIEVEALEGAAADVARGFSEDTSNFIDDALKARLESNESDREIFENFKVALSQLAPALSASEKGNHESADEHDDTEEPTLPLVFIIDELDRCRPTFALGLLEKIKHFFAVRGVIFVLVSSLHQLVTAVRFAYGDVDAHTYLEKFYHLRILLPVGRPDRPDLTAATYLNFLGCDRNVVKIIDEFARVRPLPLRTLERISAYSKIIQLSLPNGIWLPQLVAPLCIIKVLRPELYEAVRRSQSSFGDINGLLGLEKWRGQYEPTVRSRLSEQVEKWWLFALGQEIDAQEIRNFQSGLSQYNLDSFGLLPYFCELADAYALPRSQ